MKLSQIKAALNGLEEIRFVLPDGKVVPAHFHVTEIGLIDKHFIDCGGTVRRESVINFQLFTATDYDHRLAAQKLQSIIELSEKTLALPDAEIEVEHQGQTIEKYSLEFDQGIFRLIAKQTDCLAKDKCGIPVLKPKRSLASLSEETSCTPGSGCC